jgi:predicted acyltransferase
MSTNLLPVTAPSPVGRVASVDALRGLTILLMVFVNDLGPAAPSWLHHIQPPHADGMTLADVVFPWFLFIVGVSIPLAFERARGLGVPGRKQLAHIVFRTAGLLTMGVVVLNAEENTSPNALAWGTLAFSSLLLAWCTIPREPGRRRNLFIALKALGGVGLVALLALFQGKRGPAEFPIVGRVEEWAWLRTGWWGILGLIGWAYLTAALFTLALGRRREWLMGAMVLLMALHLAMNHDGGLFSRVGTKAWLGSTQPAIKAFNAGFDAVNRFIGLGDATGSLAAVVMAGCLLGSVLAGNSDVTTHRGRLRWAATFTLGLFAAGLVTDTFEGINKIGATPTWCFHSAALACLAWMVLYLLIDVAGFTGFSFLIRSAGANPLVAYFLHPITVGVVALLGLEASLLGYRNSHDPKVVVTGSLAMACFICGMTGLLGKAGLKVKL